jgi:hypothetical protein
MLQCGGVKHTRCRSSCSSSLYLSRDETRRPVLYSCHDSAIGIRACTSTLSHALSLTHRSSSINIEQKSLRLQTRQDLLPTRVALDYVVICSSSGSATTAPTVLSSHTNNNNNNNDAAVPPAILCRPSILFATPPTVQTRQTKIHRTLLTHSPRRRKIESTLFGIHLTLGHHLVHHSTARTH